MEYDLHTMRRTCLQHHPRESRDGKPPVCPNCGLTKDFEIPTFDKKKEKPMENELINKARRLVFEYIKPHLETTDSVHTTFAQDEVYVVQFAKVLQNWKALVTTTLPDDMVYEVTYNGDKKEAYIDAYIKLGNICVPD